MITESPEPEPEINLGIYPNPVSKELTISYDETIENIKLLNPFGNLILNIDVNNTSYIADLSALSTGIYFLIIKTESGKEMYKILKY